MAQPPEARAEGLPFASLASGEVFPKVKLCFALRLHTAQQVPF